MRAGLAETRDRTENQLLVSGCEIVIGEPQALHDTRTKVLYHHVRPRGEATPNPAPALALEIDADRALVPIDGEERAALTCGIPGSQRPDPIAATW